MEKKKPVNTFFGLRTKTVTGFNVYKMNYI